MSKWLILDMPSVCYWTYYATRLVPFPTPAPPFYATSAIVKLFQLRERFPMHKRIVFCFDSKTSHRKGLLPTYKEKRKEALDKMAEKAREELIRVKQETTRLRREILPDFGLANILVQKGYEADDMIAAACRVLLDEDKVIVSTDHDLFQLLDKRTVFFDPARAVEMSASMFERKYGIKPCHWSKVKALGGCTSDNVPGVPGVGEKKAIQYLTGQMPEKSVIHKRIEASRDLFLFNKQLVHLPLRGTKVPVLVDERVNRKEWEVGCRKHFGTSVTWIWEQKPLTW